MYWINFLHIYQPFDQSKKILKMVANQSYRPLFKGLLEIPGIKINININGGLTELLVKNGYQDIVDDIKSLAEENKLEFTESAKYHALLPFLDEEEIKKQILENHKINRKYFGEKYNPIAFFPPEMAYSPKVAKVVSKLGYKVLLLDEIAYYDKKIGEEQNSLFQIKNTDLFVVFRDRRVSNSIMSALVHTKKEFISLLGDDLKKNIYLFTGMDGETFGHHRPGLEKSLFKILSLKSPKQIFISDIFKHFDKIKEVNPVKSTWATTIEEIEKGEQFYPWDNPKNKVHRLQWKFFRYLIELSRKKKSLSPIAKNKLYKSMASDQFFWASGEPWWSIEMIERGAWAMVDTLKSLPGVSKSQIEKGEQYYKDILSTAFWWQRSGKIEKKAQAFEEERRIPFKERTLEKGKPEVYYAFIDTMKKKMRESAKENNFERAILWRDAIWKLETKNDIYDTIRAVDLLRLEVSDKKLRDLMDKYKEKYKKMKPGQPELRRI